MKFIICIILFSLMLTYVNAFSGASASYNLSIGLVGAYYSYNGTSNNYNIKLNLVPQSVGNESSTNILDVGYYGLISEEITPEEGVGGTGGGAGGTSYTGSEGLGKCMSNADCGEGYTCNLNGFCQALTCNEYEIVSEGTCKLKPDYTKGIFILAISIVFLASLTLYYYISKDDEEEDDNSEETS